jgi:hypothetical protein
MRVDYLPCYTRPRVTAKGYAKPLTPLAGRVQMFVCPNASKLTATYCPAVGIPAVYTKVSEVGSPLC